MFSRAVVKWQKVNRMREQIMHEGGHVHVKHLMSFDMIIRARGWALHDDAQKEHQHFLKIKNGEHVD